MAKSNAKGLEKHGFIYYKNVLNPGFLWYKIYINYIQN